MIVTFVAALVLGGIIALVTEMYRAVVVACALHAIGTLLVAAGAIALTTQTEHVDPTVAAPLEEEGVGDPDALLTDLVEDFAGAQEARGVPEVISSGHNERTVAPEDHAAASAVEQQRDDADERAVARRRSELRRGGAAVVGGPRADGAQRRRGGDRGAGHVGATGGRHPARPRVDRPAGMDVARTRQLGRSKRSTGDTRGAQRRLVPIAVFVVVGVVWFMLVVGWLAELL